VLPGRLVLLGHPVAHSLSPVFQNAALAAAGLSARYEAVDVAPLDLPRLVATLRIDRAAGNVTVPHKEAMAALCDRCTPLAERVGAVNTFWHDDNGTLIGDNTDVGGFASAARALLGGRVEGAIVGLLGAGGSAAAVCEAVLSWPEARVLLHARTLARADRLAARYGGRVQVVSSELDLLEGASLLVNATPLGLDGSLMPIAPGTIPAHVAVMDLTYRRGRTPWAQACRARGLRAEDGLPMLIEQGALSFERWFGRAPDRDVMWAAVRR
jgi:shikimate dehydrogenase